MTLSPQRPALVVLAFSLGIALCAPALTSRQAPAAKAAAEHHVFAARSPMVLM